MKTSKIICTLISLFSCLTLTKNVFSNNTSPQVPFSSLECRKDVSNNEYKVIENDNVEYPGIASQYIWGFVLHAY